MFGVALSTKASISTSFNSGPKRLPINIEKLFDRRHELLFRCHNALSSMLPPLGSDRPYTLPVGKEKKAIKIIGEKPVYTACAMLVYTGLKNTAENNLVKTQNI